MRNFERSLEKSLANLESFGRLYFTPKQLFYEFCRQQRSPIGIEPKNAAIIFGLSLIPTMFLRKNKLSILSASTLVLGTLTTLRKIPHTIPAPFSWQKFENYLNKYLENNQIEGLLKIKPEVEFSKITSDDLTLYGLPNLLICESGEITQMLRANQFHLQTPCGILSLEEAIPLSESFKEMLINAENPQVFYLHDADLESYSLLPSLREKLGLDDKISLRILGLRPVHAKRLHLFAEKKLVELAGLDSLDFHDESEKKWLRSGNRAEVSAISPARLMRVLRRLILGLEVPPSDWEIVLPKKSLGFM